MEFVLVANFQLILELHEAASDLENSPEAFLLQLEEQLESGEITLDEAAQLIRDYNKRG